MASGLVDSRPSVSRADLGVAFWEHDSAVDGDRFIGTEVLPLLDVGKQEAVIKAVTRESITQQVNVERRSNGHFNEMRVALGNIPYKTVGKGIVIPVDQDDRDQSLSEFDLEFISTRIAKRVLFQAHEIDVSAAVFNTTTWTGSDLFSDNKATPWSTVGTNIIAQVAAAREKVVDGTGMEPNTLIVGGETWKNMKQNTGIISRFVGGQEPVTEQKIANAIAAIIGIEKIMIGKANKNTADEGQDFSGSRIWPNTFAMVALVNKPIARATMIDPSIGASIIWRPVGEELAVADQWFDVDAIADKYRYRHHIQAKILDENFGHLMQIETA